MKRIASLVVFTLILTGCASKVIPVAGKVVSCSTIEVISSPVNKIQLGCLDGGVGVNVLAIRGPAIVNVWGSWCYECQTEMPILRSFYSKSKEKLTLIGVDVEEKNILDGRKYVETHGMTWPNLYDKNGTTRSNFGMGVPVTWFISPNGSVAYKKIGGFKNELELIQLASQYLSVSL